MLPACTSRPCQALQSPRPGRPGTPSALIEGSQAPAAHPLHTAGVTPHAGPAGHGPGAAARPARHEGAGRARPHRPPPAGARPHGSLHQQAACPVGRPQGHPGCCLPSDSRCCARTVGCEHARQGCWSLRCALRGLCPGQQLGRRHRFNVQRTPSCCLPDGAEGRPHARDYLRLHSLPAMCDPGSWTIRQGPQICSLGKCPCRSGDAGPQLGGCHPGHDQDRQQGGRPCAHASHPRECQPSQVLCW